MKIFFLLMLALPCFAAKTTDADVYSQYEVTGQKILSSDSVNPDDVKSFREQKTLLEEHEFQEGKVDQLNDKVEAHLKTLEDKNYKKSRYAFIDYSSWQENLSLKTPGGKKTLIVTNQGWCGGLGFGKRNARYHLGGEGCFLYGRGDIGSQSTNLAYQQSNVYGKGVKLVPAAGLIVSSGGAELGVKLPIIWFDQKFSDPTLAGYSVRQAAPIQGFANVYARWPLGTWFLQTDIGRSVSRDLTLWNIGFGKNF